MGTAGSSRRLVHPLKAKLTYDHTFKVGDVVVCVNDDPTPEDLVHDDAETPWLVKGKIYKVTWTGGHPLVGDMLNTNHDPDWFMESHAFEAWRFRHLLETNVPDLVSRIKRAKPKILIDS